MAKIEITDDNENIVPEIKPAEAKSSAPKKTAAKPKTVKVKTADEPVTEETAPAELVTEASTEIPDNLEAEADDKTVDEPDPENDPNISSSDHQRYAIQSLKPEEIDKASPEAIAEAASKVIDEPSDEPQTSMVEDDSAAAEEPEEAEPEQSQLDSPDLDDAVEDVAKSDSDELLERTDADLENAFKPPVRRSFGQKLKHWLSVWWHNKWARNLSLTGLVIIIAAIAAVPSSRYFLLNLAGVRVSASLNVTDDKTQLPLKNVHVSLAGQNAISDGDGKVSFSGLKLGPAELVLEKRAFAQNKSVITLGMGSNPLGQYKVTATGTTFNFVVTDWLSQKPLGQAEANSGEASARANKDGKISLVLDAQQSDNSDVLISQDGYRTEKITVTGNDKSLQTVKMAPDRKHLFVSKRSGKYDVYKIDADGKNEQLLVAGTGNETDDMVLVPSPSNKTAALVSTRDGQRNKDGFVLSGLYIVDVDSGQLTKLAQSERIQVVDWIGSKLIYVLVAEGASGSNPKRHRLVSYDYKTQDKKELASSNYFNDVLVTSGKVYYAPSNAFLENPAEAKLFVVNPDGSSQQTILNREAWNVFRTDYNQLAIAAQQDWYNFRIGDASATKAAGPPAQLKTKLFIDNSDRSQALWTEDRDGKGTLLLRDTGSGKDKVLESRAGLKLPVYWLNDSYVVFRVSSSDETADYVVSTQGGVAQKIRDVSSISGIDKWYFY